MSSNMLRHRSNSAKGFNRGERGLAQNEHTSSQGAIKLNNNSSTEEALGVFTSIKADLQGQISELTGLKREVIKSEQVEVSAKSRLRITIESLLIDLNEEIFALSEELAKSFTTEKSAHLISKAREFDVRKK